MTSYGIKINGGNWNDHCTAETPLDALRQAIMKTLPEAMRDGCKVSPWCKIAIKQGDLRTGDTVAMYLSAESAKDFLQYHENLKGTPPGAIIITSHRRAVYEPSRWKIEAGLQGLLDIAASHINSGAAEAENEV